MRKRILYEIKEGSPDISILIVTHNNSFYFGKCIDNIIKNLQKCKHTIEIIVLDNASSESEYKRIESYLKITISRIKSDRIKRVLLLPASKNLGYAGGNNLAASFSRGKYLAILNPDIEISDCWFDHLADILDEDSKIGVVQSTIVLPNGKIDNLGLILDDFGNIIKVGFEFNLSLIEQFRKIIYVDSIHGSAFMIRRSLFEKVGGFYPSLFMYFDEIELSLKVRLLGYKAGVITSSFAVHHHLPTRPRTLEQRALFWYYETRNKLMVLLTLERDPISRIKILFGFVGSLFYDSLKFIILRKNYKIVEINMKLIALINAIKLKNKYKKYIGYTINPNKRIRLFYLRTSVKQSFKLMIIKLKYGSEQANKIFDINDIFINLLAKGKEFQIR